jgi:hypothetical protein
MRFSRRVTPGQLPDLAFIFEGQRFGQWFLQARLQERDMPDLAPNELHEDPVDRFGVPAHAGSMGEDHPQGEGTAEPLIACILRPCPR